MTPDPGPRPFAALGCLFCFVFGLLSFVVLGARISDLVFLPLFVILLLSLILVLFRILARRRPYEEKEEEGGNATPRRPRED